MGETSTMPPRGGMNFLNTFKNGSHTRANTVSISAMMPRLAGSHDIITYTKITMLYTSAALTMKYARVSTYINPWSRKRAVSPSVRPMPRVMANT